VFTLKYTFSIVLLELALIAPVTVFADGKPPQRVTALWSNPQHLDLFEVDAGGRVISNWWEGGCGWQPWFPIHPESGKAMAGQPVTAVWSNPQHLDLFMTDDQGRVRSTWWEGAKGWQPWFVISAPSGVAKPGQAVTAVWSNPQHLDLFITDEHGQVRSTWWEGTKGWQPWFPIHPESGKAMAGQPVTAVWSNPQHLDLFMTDDQGQVRSTWWEGAKGWQPWFVISAPSGVAKPGQAVTAVWSNPQHLDLFITDEHGQVRSTWWEGTKGWQPWFPIHPESGIAATGQPVTAVWSNPQHLDLFIASANGRVVSTWWESAKGWQPWFPIQPSSGQPSADQQITALWSNPQHLDLFMTSHDGSVLSTWWEGSKSWQEWFSIYPDAEMARLANQLNVTTQLNNKERTGAYLSETTLTPASVASGRFAKLYQRQVEGQILAQPLYVQDVDTTKGRKNLLFVATAANMVYAFDADNLDANPNSGLIFSRKLHSSSPLSPTKSNSDVPVCGETYPPYIGITSTPVIDPASNTMYVVAFSSDDTKVYLHALDLRDGLKDRTGSPVAIEPPTNLKSLEERTYTFALHQRNRPGLLLQDGVVYVAFASFICDNPTPFAGWVLGYSAASLAAMSAWRTPNAEKGAQGAGIWQSGRGLVGSPDGSIYFMTGNGNENNPPGSLTNSFVKLQGTCSAGLIQKGSFTPQNDLNLSKGDTDLGSSGPILVPGDRLIGGGKQGRVYVLNATTMKLAQNVMEADGFEGFAGFTNTYHNNPAKQACTNLTITYYTGAIAHTRVAPDGGNADKYCRDVNSIQNGKPGFGWTDACQYAMASAPGSGCYLPTSCYQFCQGYGPNIHAGFVFWPLSQESGLLYALPEKDHLREFEYNPTTGHVVENASQISSFAVPDGMPGGAVALSANGNRDGIVWASMPAQEDATMGVHRGSFVAVDAHDLHELWRDDCIQYFAKFNPPIIAGGKVVLATFADPARQAVPGQNCNADPPAIGGGDLGAIVPPPGDGSAWLIVYGLK
jgi:hypothetical protein